MNLSVALLEDLVSSTEEVGCHPHAALQATKPASTQGTPKAFPPGIVADWHIESEEPPRAVPVP
jgi:hypothetical protein